MQCYCSHTCVVRGRARCTLPARRCTPRRSPHRPLIVGRRRHARAPSAVPSAVRLSTIPYACQRQVRALLHGAQGNRPVIERYHKARVGDLLDFVGSPTRTEGPHSNMGVCATSRVQTSERHQTWGWGWAQASLVKTKQPQSQG